MRSRSLFQQLQLLLLLRSIFLSFCLILLLSYEIGSGNYTLAAYGTLLCAMGANLLYILLLPHLHNWHLFSQAQVLLDSLFVLFLVYTTGGTVSIFSFLCFSVIIAWTLVSSSLASLYFSSVLTIFLSVLTILSFTKHTFYLPYFSDSWLGDPEQNRQRILVTLFAHSLGFYIVSFLSSILSQKLRRARLLYNEVLDNMKEGVLVFDSADILVFHNPQARQFFRTWGVEISPNQKLDTLLFGSEWLPLRKILERKREGDFEVTLSLRDKKIHLGLKISLIYEGNKFRGQIALLEDLTLKKQLEALEKRALRLEGIEEMALGIAHEIRNPLASIRGCVQELVLDPNVPENQELQRIILEESDRLHRILEDFLHFSRPQTLHIECFSLNELLQSWKNLFLKSREVAELTIHLELDEEFVIAGDRSKLMQVFFNLGLNSLEAGATEITIHTRRSFLPITEGEDFPLVSSISAVQILFQDNGKGIPQSIQKKIFLPFFTTKNKGTGLGLPIVWKILKQHFGHIEVQSRVGQGCLFTLWIPLESIPSRSLGELTWQPS